MSTDQKPHTNLILTIGDRTFSFQDMGHALRWARGNDLMLRKLEIRTFTLIRQPGDKRACEISRNAKGHWHVSQMF